MRLATKRRMAGIRPAQLRFARGAPALGTITFPATPLTIRVEIALGADPDGDPATWSWLDITPWVRYKPGIQIVYGRRDEGTRVDPATCKLTLDNREGRWVRRNPLGPYFGLLSRNTPIRVGINPGDGVHYRFHGFVNEWPTRWPDKSAKDSTVPIVCSGIMRRLAKRRTQKSPLTRAMIGDTPGDFRALAHWSMESGLTGTGLPSSLAGQPAAVVTGNIDFGSYDGFAGSGALPVLQSGDIKVDFPAFTPPMSAAGLSIWQVQFAMEVPQEPTAATAFTYTDVVGAGSSIVQIRLVWNTVANDFDLNVYDNTGAIVATSTGLGEIEYGTPYIWAISVFTGTAGAAGTAVLGQFDTSGNLIQQISTIPWVGGIGRPIGHRGHANSNNAGWAFGQVGLYSDPAIFATPNITPNAQAAGGYIGEQAHERIIRLCREEGISLLCTSAYSAPMGPQPTASLLTALRECETADGGVLYEHEFGLGYQSLDDRLNAPVQLTLDYTAGHVADTPEPADDDQRTVNRVVASRPAGETGVVVEDSDAIDTDGLAELPLTANVETADDLANAAGWRLWLGSVDEDRWPAIPIRFTRTPDLIPTWTALPYGARMTLSGMPTAGPDAGTRPDIDAVIEGWQEAFNPATWAAVPNTAPGSPYQAGVMGADATSTDGGVMLPDTLQLAASVAAADTSWSITTSPILSTSALDYPQRWRFRGEEVTATGVSGASSPQTATVVRAVNGISKAHDVTGPLTVDIEVLDALVMVP